MRLKRKGGEVSFTVSEIPLDSPDYTDRHQFFNENSMQQVI